MVTDLTTQILKMNGASALPARKKVFRTLFIGLGGTGNTVIRRTKYEMLRHGYDLPVLQYLVMDTMQYHEDINLHPYMHLRNGEEYLYIGGYNPNEILGNIGQWPAISTWWGNRDATGLVTVDEGAGQMRAVGRMAFFRHYKMIEEQLKRMVFEVLSANNRDRLLHKNYDVSPERAPIIYIVFSLCGGTGSSLFFDVAYVLRQMFSKANIKPTIVAIAMLPGPYLQQINSTPQKERIQANTYAALQEWERLHTMAIGKGKRQTGNALWDVQYTTSFRVVAKDLPFDYIYLIDDTASSGTRYNRDELCALLGQAIFWLAGPSTAVYYWERAKNLMSNNLAAGVHPDVSGQLRFSKYSSLCVSTVAIDWQNSRSQRVLESLILEKIHAIKPGSFSLPRWLSSSEVLYTEVGQRFIPPEPNVSGVFRNLSSVQDMLNRFSTDFTTRVTNLTHLPTWQQRRDTYAREAKKVVGEALVESLRARGPAAVYQETEDLLQSLTTTQRELEAESLKAIQDEKQVRDRYNQVLQDLAPRQVLLGRIGHIINAVAFAQWGSRSRKAVERRLKEVATSAAGLLYQAYRAQFRTLVCNDLVQHILIPTIAMLEQRQAELNDTKGMIQRWLEQNEDELREDKKERVARALGAFEEVIRIPPSQSEQSQIEQAMRKNFIDIADVVNEVLRETFRDGLKAVNTVYTDLRNAIETIALRRFANRASQERALERLTAPDTSVQRDQFWQRTECLWSYQEDSTQEASSNLEPIILLGIGEKLDELSVKEKITSLLGSHGEKLDGIPTDFADELVYLKTLHGLPVTLLHGIAEMHNAYQQMSIINEAPYLHLDNRSEIAEDYEYLAYLDSRHVDVIERWERIARDLQGVDKDLYEYITTPLVDYRSFATADGSLSEIVQVNDPDANICQFAGLMEDGFFQYSKTPATAAAHVALADLIGLLKTRGWMRDKSDIQNPIWVYNK